MKSGEAFKIKCFSYKNELWMNPWKPASTFNLVFSSYKGKKNHLLFTYGLFSSNRFKVEILFFIMWKAFKINFNLITLTVPLGFQVFFDQFYTPWNVFVPWLWPKSNWWFGIGFPSSRKDFRVPRISFCFNILEGRGNRVIGWHDDILDWASARYKLSIDRKVTKSKDAIERISIFSSSLSNFLASFPVTKSYHGPFFKFTPLRAVAQKHLMGKYTW